MLLECIRYVTRTPRDHSVTGGLVTEKKKEKKRKKERKEKTKKHYTYQMISYCNPISSKPLSILSDSQNPTSLGPILSFLSLLGAFGCDIVWYVCV